MRIPGLSAQTYSSLTPQQFIKLIDRNFTDGTLSNVHKLECTYISLNPPTYEFKYERFVRRSKGMFSQYITEVTITWKNQRTILNYKNRPSNYQVATISVLSFLMVISAFMKRWDSLAFLSVMVLIYTIVKYIASIEMPGRVRIFFNDIEKRRFSAY